MGSASSSATLSLIRRLPSSSTVPLFLFRRAPRSEADRLAHQLAQGASPFDMAERWEAAVDAECLSPSAASAWNQYRVMCNLPTPSAFKVVSIIAYALWFVCIKRNSSASTRRSPDCTLLRVLSVRASHGQTSPPTEVTRRRRASRKSSGRTRRRCRVPQRSRCALVFLAPSPF